MYDAFALNADEHTMLKIAVRGGHVLMRCSDEDLDLLVVAILWAQRAASHEHLGCNKLYHSHGMTCDAIDRIRNEDSKNWTG